MAGKMQSGTETSVPKKRRHRSKILPVIGIIVGLVILAAPICTDLYARWQNANTISSMTSTASAEDDPATAELLSQAYAYNAQLAGTNYADMRDSALAELAADASARGDGEAVPPVGDAPATIADYDQQLDADGTGGPMAWVEIPKIDVELPVYHGTSDAALASGSGHLDGTSLPVGGASTHAVLTAHSGTHAQRMFDDIRMLAEGDVLVIHTLGHAYAYKVYAIQTVWPDEVESLQVVPGEDLCTLVTCTPYGVNDHRLLVHARRTTELPAARTVADAVQQASGIRPLPFLRAVRRVAALVVLLRVRRAHRKKRRKQEA